MELRASFKQTEVGVIPMDWNVKSLKEICNMKSGVGITNDSIDEFSLYPCYGGNGHRGYTTKFTHDGKYALIGRQGALCGNVSEVSGKFFASEHAIVVTPLPQTDISWLTFVLAKMNLNQYSESSAQPGLSVEKLLKLRLPGPFEKSEQTAIASALSDADALIQSLQKLITKKRQIKQGAMQTLLNPYENGVLKPGWREKKLGEYLIGQPDYGINAAAVSFSDRLPVYIRITDISDDGEFISENPVSVENKNSVQYYLNKGDIVFARTGASVGKSYLYNPKDGPLVFAGFLIRVRPNPNFLLADYLASYVTTDRYWEWVKVMSMRSGQPGINGNEFAQLPILLPPLEEQNRITTILSDMAANIAELKSKLAKYQQIKQGMMQNLLTGRIRLV